MIFLFDMKLKKNQNKQQEWYRRMIMTLKIWNLDFQQSDNDIHVILYIKLLEKQ